MASLKNDDLKARTVEGSLNYYDGHKCCGTAADKGLAARLGGHSYNIISNNAKDEIYLNELRNDDHCLDRKGRHAFNFFEARKRKFPVDERNLVGLCMRAPEPHPRENMLKERRTETHLAQLENAGSYRGFQNRCANSFHTREPEKRYSINNKAYCNEAEKLNPKISAKAPWQSRRGEQMTRSISCPSATLLNPAENMGRAIQEDARKGASQRMTESAHFAPRQTANSYAISMDTTGLGRELQRQQKHCSVHRVENYDFAVSRKNNHFSSQDKLTRSDSYFMRPKLATTNSSVKYDIVSNERKFFQYA
jgi:hypothetical protein